MTISDPPTATKRRRDSVQKEGVCRKFFREGPLGTPGSRGIVETSASEPVDLEESRGVSSDAGRLFA